MRLFVGLGNPGEKYAKNRHNIGFMVIDVWAHKLSLSFKVFKKGLLAESEIQNERVLFFKPLTYMNLSGEAVLPVMQFYKLRPDDICVLHDDVDLAPWRIKTKKGGGSGGHNGIKSLDQHIGSEYWRVRIGIGRSEVMDTASFVLSNFSEPTAEHIHQIVESLDSACCLSPSEWKLKATLS